MYTNLYIKTNYSLLSSLVSIPKLIELANKKNIKSLGICDNDMTSTIIFYKACKKNNIKPIIGLDLSYGDNHILLYAKDYEGYKTLIKLSTIKSERDISVGDLKHYNKNVIAIIPFESINLYDEINDIFDTIYLGYSNKLEENELTKDYKDKNIVFINKVLYLKKEESKYLKYLFMIRDNKTVLDEIEFSDNYNYLLDDEIYSLSSNKGLNNTNIISDMCNLEFPKSELLLPIYKTKNNLSSDEYLKDLSVVGLNKRLEKEIPNVYKERLIYELNIIKKMGFSNYFLVVYDFIKYSKKNNILVGPGRGSAAGSLVAYSLGITDIDPIKYDLLFERFLNPERVTMPDIDTDFPDIYRDQVIDYVKDKYGEKNVAGIITFGTMGPKLALRDVGRVLNIPLREIDLLCKYIPNITKERLSYFYKQNSELKNIIDSDQKLKLLFDIASFFETFPRHTSMHAAGIVICDKELDEVVPLVKNGDLYVTGYTMEHLEELGLLKMDFLGLKNLTTIMNIIDSIEEGENIKIDFSAIPLDDKEAINIFTTANTSGIFQFESNGMKNFLRKLKPTTFEDIFAAIALFRPGPASNIDTYINRKHGKEQIEYLDPSLEEILSSTYGIIIYQEQIMQIAKKMAGYSLGEADILRRAMSKKKFNILKDEESKFINGCISNGYSKETSKKVYDLILKFANYGFNRAHSVAYSIIAYKMAYLKAKYPKYFFANLLTSAIGSEEKTKEYITETRNSGIKILEPDIVMSEAYYKVEKEGIRFPISNIRHIGTITSSEIIKNRNKDSTDIFDIISSIYSKNVGRKMLEVLIDSSCFKRYGYNTNTLHYNLDNILNYASLVKDLDPSLVLKPDIEKKEELPREILMSNERELFGLYLSNHPTTMYKSKYNVVDLNQIPNHFNKVIECIILVEKLRVINTKKGEKMAFILGSDETTTFDFTMFPRTYNEYPDIEKSDILLILGDVERRMDKYQIIVKRIKKL